MIIDVKINSNQEGQKQFLSDLDPGWTCYAGGLGSGKTYASVRKFILIHIYNQCQGLVTAPTWNDLGRFVIPEFQKACDDFGLKLKANLASRTMPPHLIIKGSPHKILVISADTPERFSGFEVGHALVDEAARIGESKIPQRDFITQCRSRIRDKSAKFGLYGIISTTPEGKKGFVYRDFYDKPKEYHRIYFGETELNSELHPDYIKFLKSQYSAQVADQYLKGKFIDVTHGLAHIDFDPIIHIGNRPITGQLHIGCDFNVSPMCWLIACQTNDNFYVFDEIIVEDNARVDRVVKLADDKGWNKGHIIVHPDKSSKNRSVTSDSIFEVLIKTARDLNWTVTGDAEGSNPPPIDRIMKVNRYLKDINGKSRLIISPKCEWTIEGLKSVSIEKNGYDKDNKYHHILDALGYLLWDAYDMPDVHGFNF